MPYIGAVRHCLSDFDLDGLKNIHNDIIKTTIKNKVFRNGTIDGLKVVAVDGVELFESDKKCCEKCLTRTNKDVSTRYFHIKNDYNLNYSIKYFRRMGSDVNW